MGNCTKGLFKANYIVHKQPVQCVGDKEKGIEPCEHIQACVYELGKEFGQYMASSNVKASKKGLNEFLRFKMMSVGK